MSSNSPSALDQSFPLPSTPTATSPGQVNCVGAKKVLTRDERRLAKMALEARNANRDLTARIKMDFAFMQFKDSEINVLRAKVESLEYENKQLKRAIEALGAGRNKEEMAKKRSGRESREDVAFLAQCVEEIGKLDDVSDASESLLLALPDDPEAARTFVPRDMGPMLGLSTGLDIRDQSGNWVAKRLQVRKSSGIVIDDDSLAENPMPNRLAKTKAAGESGKHSTIGGGRLLGDQDRNPRDKDLGIVEERIIGASSIDHLALPSVAGSMQMVGGLTNFLETLSDNPTTVTKDQQDLEKPKQEVSLNLPKGQAREIGVVGNEISASSRKEASPKSTQDSILEQRQFELCKSFLNDAKKSKIRPSILDSPLVLSPKAPTDLDDVPLGTRENQSGANPMKSQAEITISPPKEAHPSYNYEHIREVVIQNLPTDINYDKLFSCIHGGVVEAVVINMLNLEARIVFMEPESARRFYKAHEREGVWVPRETVGSRQGRKDGVVRCGLGKFLWTLKSAAPSPEMIANVWEHGKTRCLEVRNISGMTVEAIANDIMGYLKPGPTRGDVIESIMARNSDIDGQYIVVIRFTAISYAVSVQNKMAVDKRYLGCVSIFLPDTCGKLIGNRPPDIWFDEPKSLRPPNGASVGGADQGLGPELETVGHFAPKPGLKNWSKHSNQQALLWEPGYALKPEDRKVENQNVSNSASVEEENSRDLSRSVLITNLPCDIDYNTLFSKIRGGRVEHLQIFEPVTSTDSFSALILFVTSTGAQAYRDFIREWPLMVGERRITRKDHIPSDLFSNMNILPASTSQTGVTRCICIYNMREKITEKDVKADLSKAGMTEKLVQWDNANVECSVGEDSSLNLFLRFTSIAGALWARRALQKLERYGGCVFRHARDPCDNGVDELVEARDPAVKQT